MKILLFLAFVFAHHNLLCALSIANPNESPIELPANDSDPWASVIDANALHLRDQGGKQIPIDATKQPWNLAAGSGIRPPFPIELIAGISPLTPRPAATSFWYEQITHNGQSPFIPGGANWKVFRNVVADYGADSSGTSDSQSAFQKAINDGSPTKYARNTNSLGTTGQPAVVYIPSGSYTLNSPLQLYVGTVLIGDPLNPPVLKAGPNFNGNTMIYSKDPSQDSTTNFYIAIKNMKLDSTDVNKDTAFTILDWSVSQATQLTNLVFNMPNYSSGHIGISMPEGGSGTMMGDLTFNGGVVGLNMGNQQYEVKTATFSGCSTGIRLSGCFDCVFFDITFEHNSIGLDMSRTHDQSVVLLDSTASNVGTVVKTFAETTGSSSLVIENFSAGPGLSTVVSASGSSILSGSVPNTWVYGNAYTPGGSSTGSHQAGAMYNTPRSQSLLSNGKYFAMKPPTYQEYDVTQFVNVKQVPNYPVHGDGNTDDTNNLNAIITMFAGRKILFFPHGIYIVTSTLYFPAGSRVIGEGWSAISATGSNFYNPAAPEVMVKVGASGDKGVAQFSDMLFTVADVLQGCTLLEVNIAGNVPGDVGFWNTHFRVGGAADTKIRTNCDGSPASCKAAFLLLHLTPSSSAYIENMWAWTADHNLDGGPTQTVSTGRGMLVEATAATWLHGTAVEHNTLYQYNFHNAQNVFVGMQQSETPYWQGGNGNTNLAPAPWTALSAYGDPDFSNCSGGDAQCRMAWFNHISGGSNLFIYGSGFWTFFNNHPSRGDSNCGPTCQTNGCNVINTKGLYWFNVNTRNVVNMVEENGVSLAKAANNPGSWGGIVAAFLTNSGS